MFDPATKRLTNFLIPKKFDPSFRPVGLSFSPDGTALYITSIAKFEVRKQMPNGTPLSAPTPWAYDHTGVLWKITRLNNTS